MDRVWLLEGGKRKEDVSAIITCRIGGGYRGTVLNMRMRGNDRAYLLRVGIRCDNYRV